jgi:hypothetical protein
MRTPCARSFGGIHIAACCRRFRELLERTLESRVAGSTIVERAAIGKGIEAGPQHHQLAQAAFHRRGQRVFRESGARGDEQAHPPPRRFCRFPRDRLRARSQDPHGQRVAEDPSTFQNLVRGPVCGCHQRGAAGFSRLHTFSAPQRPTAATKPARCAQVAGESGFELSLLFRWRSARRTARAGAGQSIARARPFCRISKVGTGRMSVCGASARLSTRRAG